MLVIIVVEEHLFNAFAMSAGNYLRRMFKIMKFEITEELGHERAFKVQETFETGIGNEGADIPGLSNSSSAAVSSLCCKRLTCIESRKPLVL